MKSGVYLFGASCETGNWKVCICQPLKSYAKPTEWQKSLCQHTHTHTHKLISNKGCCKIDVGFRQLTSIVVTRQKLKFFCLFSIHLNKHIFAIGLPSFCSIRPEAKLFGPREIGEIVLS
ncbi:hypothetical protein Y032_0990g3309 [Ancylostoma ceylanicum]|uniref:Uncharacterized protein n=1 Tax=Ancylostoma ceylanicum TaxID=53326 RepID=A0A016W822_9BILA|nr:hypothetical protein Y032_0990g3309 [Ancylostoma ceylanicum]